MTQAEIQFALSQPRMSVNNDIFIPKGVYDVVRCLDFERDDPLWLIQGDTWVTVVRESEGEIITF